MPVLFEQTPTGTILAEEPEDASRAVALHARVSRADQKADLDRRIARLICFGFQHVEAAQGPCIPVIEPGEVRDDLMQEDGVVERVLPPRPLLRYLRVLRWRQRRDSGKQNGMMVQTASRADTVLPIARDRRLICLLALFVALGVWYNLVVPVWEAPDESEHVRYAHFLARQHRLPDRLPTLLLTGVDESHQTPLYYLLGALLTAWAQPQTLQEIQQNPFATWPGHWAGTAVAVHSPLREDWPYRGAALVTHLLRLLSTALGTGTVLCSYLLVQRALPARTDLALLAAATVAFLPGFVFSSSTVNNDALLVLLSSIVALMVLTPTGHGPIRPGVMLALTVGAKLSGIVVLAAAVLSRWMRAGVALRDTTLLAAPGLLVALGWGAVRGLGPTLVGREMHLSGVDVGPAEVSSLLVTMARTFIGAFGRGNVLLPEGVYLVLGGLAAPALAAALLRYPDRALVARLMVWPTLLFLATFLRWALPGGDRTGSDHGRYLYPALAPMMLLLALGWAALPRPIGLTLARTLVTALLLTTTSAPLLVIAPAYAYRTEIASFVTTTPAEGATHLNLPVPQGLQLVGYKIQPECLKPGDVVRLHLYWQAHDPHRPDVETMVYITGQAWPRTRLSQRDPGHGLYPSSVWLTEEVVRDDHEFWIGDDMPTGDYELAVAAVPYQRTAQTTIQPVPFIQVTLGPPPGSEQGCP